MILHKKHIAGARRQNDGKTQGILSVLCYVYVGITSKTLIATNRNG
jgi:hypothetical protein